MNPVPAVRTESPARTDPTAVRMFVSELGTIRWETRVAEDGNFELKIFGPGALRRAYAFRDAFSLVEYQSKYERHLLASGYALLPTGERRSSVDRRRELRLSDRRSRE